MPNHEIIILKYFIFIKGEGKGLTLLWPKNMLCFQPVKIYRASANFPKDKITIHFPRGNLDGRSHLRTPCIVGLVEMIRTVNQYLDVEKFILIHVASKSEVVTQKIKKKEERRKKKGKGSFLSSPFFCVSFPFKGNASGSIPVKVVLNLKRGPR